MRTADDMEFKVRKMSGMTLNVNVILTREFRLRVWLAMFFFRIGVWISGMEIEVNRPDE